MKESKFMQTKKAILEALEEKQKSDFEKLIGGFLSLAIGNIIINDTLAIMNGKERKGMSAMSMDINKYVKGEK